MSDSDFEGVVLRRAVRARVALLKSPIPIVRTHADDVCSGFEWPGILPLNPGQRAERMVWQTHSSSFVDLNWTKRADIIHVCVQE